MTTTALDRDAAATLMEPLTDIVVQAGAAILAVTRSTMQVTGKPDEALPLTANAGSPNVFFDGALKMVTIWLAFATSIEVSTSGAAL